MKTIKDDDGNMIGEKDWVLVDVMGERVFKRVAEVGRDHSDSLDFTDGSWASIGRCRKWFPQNGDVVIWAGYKKEVGVVGKDFHISQKDLVPYGVPYGDI